MSGVLCVEAEGWHVSNLFRLLMHVAAIVMARERSLSLCLCTSEDTPKHPSSLTACQLLIRS